MDEIGIPIYEDTNNANLTQSDAKIPTIPSPSPYENVYVNRNVYTNLKPKSPNTNSPRTRIKTTFAYKNVTPQYFVFPTPSPKENSRNPFENQDFIKDSKEAEYSRKEVSKEADDSKKVISKGNNYSRKEISKETDYSSSKEICSKKDIFEGIEKQLSLEEEIPMIDDELTNDLEFRYSKVVKENEEVPNEIKKNQSFDDVKKELMADIPELEAFENDLKYSKRDKIIKTVTEDIDKIHIEDFTDTSVLDINIEDLKARYEKLKEDRRKLVTEIHDIKCKMTEIRSQEDDILREVSCLLLINLFRIIAKLLA